MKRAIKATTTTLPALILTSEQHADLRDLLEGLMDWQIAEPYDCTCGHCDADADEGIECVPTAGEALDILDSAIPVVRMPAIRG